MNRKEDDKMRFMMEKIAEDLKSAMKDKKTETVSALRMVQAALKNKRIELMRDLTEDDAVAVLRSMLKQYKDSLGDFRAGGRQDLVQKTEREIEILSQYLPPELSEEKIREFVRAKKEELGAIGTKDFGRLMSGVMKELGSGVRGEVVAKIAREELG